MAAALGVGLAAINLLPAAELTSVSNRGGEYPTDPYALHSLFSAFVGANRPSAAFPLQAYFFYVGIVSFAPIFVAFKRWRDPYVRAAVALGVGTAALLLVGFVAKPLLVDLVPPLASVAFFRPAFFIGFAAAVLVAYGLQEPDWRLGHGARRVLAVLLLVQASLLIALAVLGAVLITTRLELESPFAPCWLRSIRGSSRCCSSACERPP